MNGPLHDDAFDAKVNTIAGKINWPIGNLVYLVAVVQTIFDSVISPEFRHDHIRRCEIEALAPVPSHLDGDDQPLRKDFRIAVLPAALRLL